MVRRFAQLSFDERRVIGQMWEKRASQAVIARALGRDRSTICRELRRNFFRDKELPDLDGYWPMTAQSISVKRRRQYRKFLSDPALCDAVIEKLKAGWSPEQIAGRLRAARETGPSLSHETIYRYVYSSEGQEKQLARLLPERRKKRKPRYARKPRNLVFPLDCAIGNRPEAVKARQEFGHWEADLMIFRKEHGSANIATVVERKSRFTLLFRNNDRRSKPLMTKLIQHLSPLPLDCRKSLTFDRGIEFVAWRELMSGMGTQAWFCDPQAPWQKGTVENTNKRLRRYLPAEAIILEISDAEISALSRKLNDTPRKCLGFQTPTEVFGKSLGELTLHKTI